MIDIFIVFPVLVLAPAIIGAIFLNRHITHFVNLPPTLVHIIGVGIGPMLLALLHYYALWLIPNQSAWVYVGIIMAFELCAIAWLWFKKYTWPFRKPHSLATIPTSFRLVGVVLGVMVTLYALQAIALPIVDNDKALYLNEAQGYFEQRNLQWVDEHVRIRGNDIYDPNESIRPGIPVLTSLGYVFGGSQTTYLFFKLITFYYYALLLLLCSYIVFTTASKVAHTHRYATTALFSTVIVFSWGLSRMAMFGHKEAFIYFFGVASLYIAYVVSEQSKRSLQLEILLAVLLGVNMFINLHGVMINVFILCLLLLINALPWKQRILQLLHIFVWQTVFSAFEFFVTFQFIFGKTLDPYIDKLVNYIQQQLAPNTPSAPAPTTPSVPNNNVVDELDATHKELYQINSNWSYYIKSKLQVFTKVGEYGLFAWISTLVLLGYIKQVWKNGWARFGVLFLILYIFVILDPLNINPHPYAIVLSGSYKYALYILLLLTIMAGPWMYSMILYTYTLVARASQWLGLFVGIGVISSLFLREQILDFGFWLLSATIPMHLEASYYESRVELVYWVGVVSGLVFTVYCVWLYFTKHSPKMVMLQRWIFTVGVVVVSLSTFIVTNPGKVPLVDTFSTITKSREEKLTSTIYQGDMFAVYQYATEHIPRDSYVSTSLNELYSYDTSFALSRPRQRESVDGISVQYHIGRNCPEILLYESGPFKLCDLRAD